MSRDTVVSWCGSLFKKDKDMSKLLGNYAAAARGADAGSPWVSQVMRLCRRVLANKERSKQETI